MSVLGMIQSIAWITQLVFLDFSVYGKYCIHYSKVNSPTIAEN